jgi:hypothetical protein
VDSPTCLSLLISMRAIWKATSGELLTKQVIRKKKLSYTIYIYILMLLQPADFFYTGTQKLIPRYDECLNSGGDYYKKQFKYVCISSI